MRKKNLTLLLIITVVLVSVMLYNSLTTQNKFYNNFAESQNRDELIVAIDENQAGYSKVDGKPIGFLYDILNAYSKEKGVKLTIVPKISPSYAMDMLENGNVDIASLTSIDRSQLNIHNLLPKFNSKFVVVANRSNGQKVSSLGRLPAGKKIVVTQNFKELEEYRSLIESANNSVAVSAESPQSLMSQLAKHKFDYLVCNDFDAKKFIESDRSLKIIHELDGEISQMLSISIQNSWLESSFNDWFKTFVVSEAYIDISYSYHGDSNTDANLSNTISRFDTIIKSQSRELGFDWRLISAIAYNESRFKPEVRSHRGAAGLMQIMPQIARHYNMDADEIQQPKNNVEVALKLLIAIEQFLKLPSNTPESDKLAIMLACYNGGIGHVSDARKLAAKYGFDNTRWANVSKFLLAKRDAEFYNDSVVKHGSFTATETLSFVNKVLNRYETYCQVASL